MPTLTRRIAAAFFAVSLLSCNTVRPSSQLQDEHGGATAAAVTDAVQKLTLLEEKYKAAVVASAREALKQQAFAVVNALSIAEIQGVMRVMMSQAGGKIPYFAKMDAADREGMVLQLADSVAAEASHHDQFASWTAVKTQLDGIVGGGGNGAVVGDDGFAKDIERLARTHFLAYDLGPDTATCDPHQNAKALTAAAPVTCVLRNGEASFAERDYLVAHATQRIWIFSWAMYDDYTGRLYRDKLLAKKAANPEIDIRVVVDGATASRDTYKEVINALIAGGIQVIRWRRVDDFRGYGLHRKVMIVDPGTDHGAVIIGGQNFGDQYSRINPAMALKDKWRDTDLLVTGQKPVLEAAHVFGTAWNAFQANPPPPATANANDQSTEPLLAIGDVPPEQASDQGDNLVAFVNHEPSQNVSTVTEDGAAKTVTYDPVYLVTLRAIAGAQRTIDISNAYYIAAAPIETALIAAARRGVRVRVHTNSKDSIDEAFMVDPIMHSLATLMAACSGKASGCVTPEVFLRQTSTLHTKLLVVDSTFGWIGSYNLHPRSYWYESEAVMAFLGPDLGGKVQALFNRDVTLGADPETKQVEVKKASPADVASDPKETVALLSAVEDFFFNLY